MPADTIQSVSEILGRLQTVIAVLDRGLKSGPTDAMRGEAAGVIGQLDEGVLMASDLAPAQKLHLTRIQTKAATVLRKLGFVEDALKLSRRAVSSPGSDIWAVRAYGWALRDSIKKARDGKNDSLVRELVREFDRLEIPADETLLLEQRAHYRVGIAGTEEQVVKAFGAAMEKHAAQPDDPGVTLTFFWALADCIEQAVWLQNLVLARRIHDEIGKLTVTDEKQTRKLSGLRAKLDATHSLRMQANELSKQGDHVKAAAIYRQALEVAQDSKETQTGLGWELFRLLQAELAGGKHEAKKPEAGKVKALLREYLGLEHVEKPSVLHSQMLSQATRARVCLEQLYPSFVKRWGVENLRDEDYLPYVPKAEDKDDSRGIALHAEPGPSLAERVGKGIGKTLKGLKSGRIPESIDLDWVKSLLEALVNRFPQHPWIPYYYAKALLLSKDLNAARTALVPIVRAKHGEFWAWATLAETFDVKTGERLACLCRAALCRVKNRELLNGVFARLRSEFHHVNEHDAVRALEKIVPDHRADSDIVNDESQMSPDSPDSATTEEAVAPGAWRAACEKYSPLADEIILAGVPWMDAMVSGRVAASGDTKGSVFVVYAKGDSLPEVRVRSGKHVTLDDARVGAPVAIRIARVDGRDLVVSAKARDGQAWDLLPEKIGVVKNINADKAVTAIAIGLDEFTLAYFDHFPEARELRCGEAVAVRLQALRPGSPPRLVSMKKSTSAPDGSFFRLFEDIIRIHEAKGCGFAGDVYVPRPLLDAAVADGRRVKCAAIRELNPKTGRQSWRAVTIESIE